MQQAGRYQIYLSKQGQEVWQQFIIHTLDKRSSDLSVCKTVIPKIEHTAVGKVQRIRTRVEHMIPLAITLLAALAAWFCYRNEQGINT
jgi:hypothetical protein